MIWGVSWPFGHIQKMSKYFSNLQDDLNDAAHGAKDFVNDLVGGKCNNEDDCYFFQGCENKECKVEIWAWIVLIAGVTAIVVGIVSCIVCCCCNACSRK